MIYSTQTCPHCKAVLRTENNPSLKIGNPFDKCRKCNNIILNPYRQEWITLKPLERSTMKAKNLFNKNEFNDNIERSLRRTKVIEYVEYLKQAGFEIYPIDGYDVATIHDNAVDYSLIHYDYPKDDGQRIKRQELPHVIDFTRNGYDRTVKFLNIMETGLLTLTHTDRVYFAYRAFKIQLSEALFPDGIIYADFIINEFAKNMNIKLEKCQCNDYFHILIIYYELLREMMVGHSAIEIVANMRSKFPNILTKDSIVEALLSNFQSV